MRFSPQVVMLVLLPALVMGQPPEQEETAIRELWERFSELYEARDAEGIANLYAEDADRFAQVSNLAAGRAAIREQYQAEFARYSPDADLTPIKPTEVSIRFVRPDVAILDGISSPSETVSVYFTVFLTKDDGQWMLAAGRPRGRVVD